MTDLLRRLEVLAEGIELSRAAGWNNIAAALRGIIASEKARGPDPLLVQAREALARIEARKVEATPPWTHEQAADVYARTLDWDRQDAHAALAALDARLGVKK